MQASGVRESRRVFSVSRRLHDLPPVAVRALWEYSLSRGVRRSCTDLGERVPVPRGGTGARWTAQPCSLTVPRFCAKPSTLGGRWGWLAGKQFLAQGVQHAGVPTSIRQWPRHPSCSMFSQRLTSEAHRKLSTRAIRHARTRRGHRSQCSG